MSTRACRGVTLIELVVFIVLVGVAMAGVFAAFNTITAASADPQVRKQVLAIAESLMEEVALMPFSWCDPDDANAATATNSTVGMPGGCATVSEDGAPTPFGPETGQGESRYSTTFPFDNVSDYHTFSMGPGIQDITSTNIVGLGAYSATISVAQTALATGADLIPATESLRISVTVTGPGTVSITLEGYRTRYAPTTLP